MGVGYHLGVDGISAPMALLTGLASFTGVLISWHIDDRPREFFAFFMLLVAGVYGVFLSLDLFLLFFFYELAIFPMYVLIATWGWKVTRVYSSMKLTLYILVGSVVALVGVIAMVLVAEPAIGKLSFDIVDLMEARDAGAFDVPVMGAVTFARARFPFIFLGFGILAGVFPELRARGFLPIYVRTLENPLRDLCRAIRGEQSPGDSFTAEELQTIISDDLHSFLRDAASDAPMVLILDQFEEFFIRFRQKPKERSAPSSSLASG